MKGSAISGPVAKECADLWPRIASNAGAGACDSTLTSEQVAHVAQWSEGFLFFVLQCETTCQRERTSIEMSTTTLPRLVLEHAPGDPSPPPRGPLPRGAPTMTTIPPVPSKELFVCRGPATWIRAGAAHRVSCGAPRSASLHIAFAPPLCPPWLCI
jgi:hypothetical protein